MTSLNKDEEWYDYPLEAFYNEVVEATMRYIKGKGYGEDPETYLKKQLSHWEENFKEIFKAHDLKVRNATEKEIVEKIEKGFDSFLLQDWSGEYEVYDEINRLKKQILASLSPQLEETK